MRKTADIVIIGAGNAGCSIAFHLAEKGFLNILVLDRNFTSWGGTGRCGAGFRETWGSETNCRLASFSINAYEHIEEITGYPGDCEIIQDGYLFTCHKQRDYDYLYRNLEVQHKLGIQSQCLTPEEVRELVPGLTINDGMIAGFFNQRDGHGNPFKTAQAYKYGAKRHGVEFMDYTEVLDIETKGDKVCAVLTNRGRVETPLVINAAGAYAKYVSQMLGLSLPLEPEKHEILITEPYEYTRKVPMVYSYEYNTYISHLQQGGYLMGWGDVNVQTGKNWEIESSWKFLDIMAKNCVHQLPALAQVRIIRQWAGHYCITADNQVILGYDPQVEGYFYGCGASKAFMLGPAIGTLVSQILAGEETFVPTAPFSVERFAKGELIPDFSFV